MAARPILSGISLVLVAGAVLFQFFIILSGGIDSNTWLDKVYFLHADTNGIVNASPNTAWTYFATCDYANGRYTFCRDVKAAAPFNPYQNFGSVSTENIPADFLGNHYYYYMSRFAWAFYLISLFFGACTLVTGLLALCTRIGAFLSGGLAFSAFFFQTMAAALMTAWTVKGRDAFRRAGRSAGIGAYAYGFTWATVVLYMINIILFCVSGTAGRNADSSYTKKSRWNAFGRKRSTRSTGAGSMRDSTNGGIKEEYE